MPEYVAIDYLVYNSTKHLVCPVSVFDFSWTTLHRMLHKCQSVETLELSKSCESVALQCPELEIFISRLKRLEVPEFKGEDKELLVRQNLLSKVVYFGGSPSRRRKNRIFVANTL
ncbi:hypothetical protein ACFE04_021384 [Oxalis oulophora]